MYTSKDVLEAARVIRLYLPDLLGAEAETVDRALAELLAKAESGEAVDNQILELLAERDSTREWTRQFLIDKIPPPVTKSFDPSLFNSSITVRDDDSLEESIADDNTSQTPSCAAPRYLQTDVPERAKLGDLFTLIVRIVLANNQTGSTQLRLFNVPAEGIDVKITVTGSAFTIVSGSAQMLHVPADADSDPLLFELKAIKPGVQKLEILAFNGGAYLGSHFVQITVDDLQTGPSIRQSGLIEARNANEGEATLTVKYDPDTKRYRYVLRSQTIGETDDLLSGPLTRPREELIKDFVETLNAIARGGVSLSPSAARVLLKGKGTTLWKEMIPPELQRTFWEYRESIKQLRIICGSDPIPWEVLCPNDDNGIDNGFLAEQFPVTRWRPGPPAPLNLQISQPLFVLPDKSPAQAQSEIANLKQKLKGGRLVEQLDELLIELQAPQFNVLHFACHNTFVADKPLASYINMNGSPFVPDMLAGIGRSLRIRSPLVFMNACRTAGSAPTYTQLSGWADKFLDAGAAAFIGSLWEIRDSSAPKFAESVYDSLLPSKDSSKATTLGDAVWKARQAIQEETGDPTWLAYVLYGNPDATVTEGE
jgi:hypothetical protein